MLATQRRILSIGCSCINRFQFDFYVDRYPDSFPIFPRGLFDWNIASLEASLNVLRLAALDQLGATLQKADAYSVAYDSLIVHADLPGFSFFHEKAPHELLAQPERREAFLGKLDHLSQPFTTRRRDAPTHLVWSNLQPNLPDTVRNVIPWEDFVLTDARRSEVISLCREIFGDDTTFSFLSTPADADPEVAIHSDVTLIDLPRGEGYRGEPDLYAELLRKLVPQSV